MTEIQNPDINETENVEATEPDEVIENSSNVIAEPVTTDAEDNSSDIDEGDTFPRDYVEKLRGENAKYRQRAQRADDLAQRLHTALVDASGRLQDAGDLPFEESHIDDPEALTGAIDELLKAKPHLASRRPSGNVGQGASTGSTTVDLAALMRSRA